jgi:hypothetical protein
MADPFAVADMKSALRERRRPTVMMWNRIEGRPRTVDFGRALRVEVRDALWMLTRQWQAGEFRAEDGGSPVFARTQVDTTRLTRYQAGSAAPRAVDPDLTLEAQTEWRPLQFTTGADKIALDLRLTLGRRWLKQIAAVGPYADLFTSKYKFDLPDPTRRDSAAICAHAEVWQGFAAVAGRAMDGGELYRYLVSDTTHRAYDGIAVLDHDKPALDVEADRFVAWVRQQFSQLGGVDNPAWQASRFEYQIACSAPTADAERVFVADEHRGGSLDWHSLDVDSGAALAGADTAADPRATIVRSLLPVPISYAGMPHPRWWTMEDGRTNFGDIRPDTTDLAKLLFVEFGLVYSNDWFIVPFTVAAGSLVSVQGIAVTTVFGERFWIERAGSGSMDAWQRWSIFTLDDRNTTPTAADTTLLILPTVPKVQDGPLLEEVLMIRDEMANMVWGIEKTISAADGQGRSGATAGRETREYHERLVSAGPTATESPLFKNNARIRFSLMSTVPEHWIPFISVRASGSQRASELQRASMPRVIEGDPLRPFPNVKPCTSLLRPGLDTSRLSTFLIPEEEVPRGGARLLQRFRRARGADGRVHLWLAAHKQVGRGEGSGGLSFDTLAEKAPESNSS